MLARDIVTLMDGRGSLYPFAAVRELLADADVTVANLEGTFTERGTAADKFYTFRTPPRHARGLAEAGIDVVSLGNNHSMDFGGIGLADTLAALDAAGLRYSGAGEDEAAARRPALLTVRGLRLAFLSYSAVSESTPAGTGRPGVAWGEAAAVGADVRAARAHADVVIVSLHAGNEYQDAPSGTQRALAQAAIEAGALLVLGHHAHVLQGWERYNGGPSTGPSASSGGTSGQALVVYGLGNFVFDLDSDDLATLGPRPFQSCVLHIVLTRNAVESVGCRPVRIDPIEDRPRSAAGEAAREIEARVEMLNAGLR